MLAIMYGVISLGRYSKFFLFGDTDVNSNQLVCGRTR